MHKFFLPQCPFLSQSQVDELHADPLISGMIYCVLSISHENKKCFIYITLTFIGKYFMTKEGEIGLKIILNKRNK